MRKHFLFYLPYQKILPYLTSQWQAQIKISCIRFSFQFSSVEFSVVSDSATPWTTACQASLSITISGVYSNSCPLSQWCHPTISSSVIPLLSYLQSVPASGSFSINQFFTSVGQIIGVSASASVLSLGLTGWISLQSKGFSRVFSNSTVQKH